MQKGGEGVQIACQIVYIQNDGPPIEMIKRKQETIIRFCEIIPNFCEIVSAMQDIISQKVL